MNRRYVGKWLRLLWVLLCITVIVVTFIIYDGTPATRDAELILIYGMMMLSFPAGQIIALIFAALGYALETVGLGLAIPSGYSGFLCEWVVFFAVGYVQWFIVVPFFVRWLRARGQRREETPRR